MMAVNDSKRSAASASAVACDRYPSTARASASAVPGYQGPATAAGRMVCMAELGRSEDRLLHGRNRRRRSPRHICRARPFRACRFAMLAFAMAAEFTAAQVAAIAALAQREIEPHEVQLFARQLGGFLGYADEVLAIDTTGVAPTAYGVTRHESERPDQVHASLARE